MFVNTLICATCTRLCTSSFTIHSCENKCKKICDGCSKVKFTQNGFHPLSWGQLLLQPSYTAALWNQWYPTRMCFLSYIIWFFWVHHFFFGNTIWDKYAVSRLMPIKYWTSFSCAVYKLFSKHNGQHPEGNTFKDCRQLLRKNSRDLEQAILLAS